MLEHTKKHPIEIKFVGPVENRQKAVNALLSLGFADISGSIPAKELFEEFEDGALPGIALVGARAKENLTQKQLSSLSGISQGHISEMENNKRPIGKKTARLLGKLLGVSYRVFL